MLRISSSYTASPTCASASILSRLASAADIGRTITDEKNRTYVLALVTDADKFVMHPDPLDPSAPVGQAVFPRHDREKLFFDGREIKFSTYLALKKVLKGEPATEDETLYLLRLLDYYIRRKTEEELNSLRQLLQI